jgi:hypothetical protein
MSSFFIGKFFGIAFMRSQFGFVIFWQKDFGAKAAHKIVVKLTSGGTGGSRTIDLRVMSPVLYHCASGA